MSRLLRRASGLILLSALMIFYTAAPKTANAQPNVSVTFQTFYNSLSPYGQWINYPGHGYCWTPNGVGRDFRPYYSNGYWAMTDYGNTWVSNYNWGWAPFHYGRWMYDDYYGWMWVPGNTWGPAWVSWRSGGGCYGWAPLAPGININVNIGPRYNDWWVFVPQRNIYSNNLSRYYRGPRYSRTVINNTTIINNTYNNRYVYGPRRNEIERATGQRIRTYNVRSHNTPGRTRVASNTISTYRPNVSNGGRNVRPQKVVNARTRGNSVSPRTTTRATMPSNRAQSPVRSTPNTRTPNRRPQTAPTRQRSQQVTQRPTSPSRRTSPANTRPQAQRVQQERITRQRQQQWQQQSKPAQRSTPQTRSNNSSPQRSAPVRRSSPSRAQQRTSPARQQSRSSMQRSAPTRSSAPSRGNNSRSNRGKR